MKKTILIIIVILILVIGGYFLLRGGYQAPAPTTELQVQIKEGSLEEVQSKFIGTTLADWPGYQKDLFCIDSSLTGQPELGAMGFHASKSALIDFVIDPLEPELLLIDGNDNVVGVEYMVPSQEAGQPELFGQPFEPSEPHQPAVPMAHYDLHLWLIDNPLGIFVSFNPNLTCPERSLPPASSPQAVVKELTVSGAEFSFDPASITVSAGESVRITFKNNGRAPHNLVIEGLGVSTKTIGGGQADTTEFIAPSAGTYAFICSVPGHRASGMEGSLIVE